MNRIKIKKPAGGQPTGKAGTATKNSREFKRYCSISNKPLSTLLDQALHRFEHYSDLARIYAAEAEKHKAILSSLQSLIPPGKRGRGGAA